MYLNSKFNFRKFLVALLSMLMAVMLAFSVACSNGDDTTDDGDDGDTTPETTQAIDYQSIKNGDFEFGSKENTTYPLSSSINWSKNMGSDVTSAPSSKGSSGIIDTAEDKFSKLTSKNKPTVNPETPFAKGLIGDGDYEKYDSSDKAMADDEDLRVNPQVGTKFTKILMINNNTNGNGVGTAQSYKASSSISVAVDEFAILSFWLKTDELKSVYTATPGAYVKIACSAGSNSYDDFYVKGIDTKGEWAKFSFAFAGSTITATTVSLTIGLGEGNGTDQNGFVEGFVFVDNVFTKKVSEAEYNEASSKEIKFDDLSTDSVTLPAEYKKNDTESDVLTDKYSVVSAKFNFTYGFENPQALTGTPAYNAIAFNNTTYDTATGNQKGNELAKAKEALPSLFGANDEFIKSAVYMNFNNYSSAYFETNSVSIGAGEYKYVTFFAKVNAYNTNSDKLKVEVKDLNGDASQDSSLFASFETSALESERYNNWIKYQAFINNPTDESTEFKLKFTFGADVESISDAYMLQKGYAVIANLTYADTNEETYNLATAGDRLVKKQIFGKYLSYDDVVSSETNNDVYGIAVDKSQTFSIREKPATNISSYSFKTTQTDKAKVTYGLINSKYYKGGVYGKNVTFSSVLDLDALKTLGNTYTQAVIIDNKEEAYSRYVTSSHSITAESISQITVKVRAYGDAVANVSLVSDSLDTDTYEYETIKFEVGEFNSLMSSKITSSSYTKDGWTTVHFYVKAGNEDLNLRVMIANGSEDVKSKGAVLFDGVTYATIDAAKLQADKIALKLNFEQYANTLAENARAEYLFGAPVMATRNPSTIKSDGENGEVVETTQYYSPAEVYLGNAYAKFFSYETIHAEDVIDNTTSNDDSTSDSTTTTDEYAPSLDATLQISSIIIAIVLIGVIITILVRDSLKKRAKRKARTQAYYEENSGFDRNTREKTLKKIAEKKAKIALASDDEEYDYELASQINEEEEVEETVEETVEEETQPETVEETTEEPAEESEDKE